ncbi:DUF4190 domain-containing protein [Thermoleophilia bacterium SCSIO 60948]|nr:DUF4190 domain-containing protein [Thermoleophilia bacterium SCSIO 60948]
MAQADGDRRVPDRSESDDSEVSGETSGLAIASLFLSIIWLFGIGSAAGIWLGFKSLRSIKRSSGTEGGRVLAIAGVVIGLVGFASLGLVVVFALYSAR